jgi:hypothetical protein
MKENQNQIKNDMQAEEPEKKPETKASAAARSFIFGDILKKQQFIGLLPYILFVTFLTMVYITNSYYAEKTVREIDKTNNDLKELSSEYISIKSELMFKSKPSEVAKMVVNTGIKESVVPPGKIESESKK